jgi:uroporphyrinogen decarboxylase
MTMTPRERILTALKRQQPDRVPTFEWFIDAAVGNKLVGSTDPIDIVERLDIDAVNLRADYDKEMIDQTTFINEWGITKQLTGDVLAAAIDHPIKDLAAQADYELPDPAAPQRLKTIERAIEQYGDKRAVVLNLRDGFSDMRDLLGYQNALIGLLIDPVNYAALLDRCVEYQIALAKIAVERFGIQIVATTDDVCTATGPLFDPQSYENILYPAFKKVMQGYKDQGLLIIKHCDGDVSAFLDLWIDAGIDCLDPIDPTGGHDMADMKARFGDKISLKGNIDCTGPICDGTPEQVVEEVKTCLEKGMKGGGLIISSSNTIHRGVSPENYRVMLDAIREYGVY